MSSEKIDSKLRAEVERLEQAGASEKRLSVIIEPAGAGVESQGEDIDTLGERVKASQATLQKRLADLGITDAKPMTLANALVAELTPAQIRRLASDAAVKRILWNVAEKVTL